MLLTVSYDSPHIALQGHVKKLQQLTGNFRNTIIRHFGCLHSYLPTSF